MKIHFVCRGNALRSVIAEAYLKSKEIPKFEVSSSGTVAEQYRERNKATLHATSSLLAAHQIGKYGKQCADQLSEERLKDSDLIVFMNGVVYEEAKRSYVIPHNVRVWNIVDAGEGQRNINPGDNPHMYDEDIFNDIKPNVDALMQELYLK